MSTAPREPRSPHPAGPQPAGLQVRTEQGPDGAVVALAGELDLAGAHRAEAALEAAQAAGGTLEVDLRELMFMDSTGLKLIVACQQRAAGAGGRLVVVVGGGPVQRLLELTGLDAEVEMRVGEPLG